MIKSNRSKPLKIFIGINEIANNISEFSNALRNSGHYVESFSKGHDFYPSSEYTYYWPREKFQPTSNGYIARKIEKRYLKIKKHVLLTKLLADVILSFDVCVFIWTRTFWPYGIDLFLLRLFRKKVIVFNCGSDVRFAPIHVKIDREIYGIDIFSRMIEKEKDGYFANLSKVFRRTFYRQKIEELSGCKIVSMRNQATFMKKPVYFFRFPNRRLIEGPKSTNSIPSIIHAPSRRSVKGTDHVLSAVDRLREEGLQFDFELIENKDNEYVLSRLRTADIVIDQPGTWVARFAAEALASGCVVVGGNRPKYEHVEDHSPVIQFEPDPDALAKVLRPLITDASGREQLMRESYEYWDRNYSYDAFGKYFEALLAGEAPVVPPLENHKALLMRFALSRWQRLAIWAFY